MKKYRVKYQLELVGQEVDLSTVVTHYRAIEDEKDMENIIDKANDFINKNAHIPINMLNEADIEIIPAP